MQRAKFAAPTQEYKEAFNLSQLTWSAEQNPFLLGIK